MRNQNTDIYEPSFVKKLFNQMSSSYEKMNYITSFGFSIRWRKQFIRKVGSSPSSLQIIDLLSGLGENWSLLKRNFPNATFHALDFSEQMIAQSKSKANRVFSGQLQLHLEDILQNNLPSNHFDIITCAYGLKTFNTEQLNILAREVHRILKPGGKFTFVEVSKPNNKILLFFYKLYLSRIIPRLGKLFLGNPSDYKMLWIYTERFENSLKVSDIFAKYALHLDIDRYFFGCATGITGTKH